MRLCPKNRSTFSIRRCCFDIVAGVDGALVIKPRTWWTYDASACRQQAIVVNRGLAARCHRLTTSRN